MHELISSLNLEIIHDNDITGSIELKFFLNSSFSTSDSTCTKIWYISDYLLALKPANLCSPRIYTNTGKFVNVRKQFIKIFFEKFWSAFAKLQQTTTRVHQNRNSTNSASTWAVSDHSAGKHDRCFEKKFNWVITRFKLSNYT